MTDRTFRFRLCASGIGVVALATTLVVHQSSRQAAGQVDRAETGQVAHIGEPVFDVKQFMEVFNKPLYMELKNELGDKPNSDQAWKDVETDALQAAEIANLIAIRRVPKTVEPVLQKRAADLQNASMSLARAAKSKNLDEAHRQWAVVVQACNGCHKEMAPDKAPQLQP